MKTKESIDRHAKLVLASARGQDGKHSYNIARLYFDAECYNDARTHVNAYLQSYGNSDWRAHKLLGDIEFAEGAFQEALHTYKDVLRLQPECKEALLKVGLLSAKLRPVEESAKWVREIEKRYPCESKLNEIRDIIATRRSGDRISKLRDTSTKFVNDVEAQCEYLNELINSRQFRQAFDFVVERVGMFRNSLQWHKLCSVTCENFMATQPAPEKERIGNFLILITYFRQFLLTAATSPVNSMKTLLQKLDRAIFRFISGYSIERLNDSSELCCCAKEMAACLLASVVILVNKLLLQRSQTLQTSELLLIVCCRVGLSLKPHDNNIGWAKNSFSYGANLGNPTNVFEGALPSTVWNLLAAERMSFFVHMFKSVQNAVDFDHAVFGNADLQTVKEQLLNIIYPPGTSMDSSFLSKYLHLFQNQMYPPLENSEEFLVSPICDSSFRDYMLQSPQNVDLVCWVLLSKSGFPVSKEITSLRWMITDRLPINAEMSSNRVSNTDLQAFALAASFWIGENLACYNKIQPFLPLMPLICTASVKEQADVWHSLIGVRPDETQKSSGGTSLPAFPLFQALQIVRAQNNAMPTALVVSLAQSFNKLAQTATEEAWKETYSARSAHYWQKALPSLQNIARGLSSMCEMEAEHNSRLFPSSVLPKLSMEEAKLLHEKGTYEVALWLKNQGNLDDSLYFLSGRKGAIATASRGGGPVTSALSPQCALLRTEILYEKMSEEPSNKSTQRDLMNASLKELNALMKRKDVSPLVKKQAQLQAFSAEAKLEDLQRAEELENSLAEKSATGMVEDIAPKVSLRDLAISDKLDGVSTELFEVNKNLCTIAEELREMQCSWTASISQVTSLVGKLVEIELQKKVAQPHVPPMGMPGPSMGLPPQLFPQGQIPSMIGQYPQQIAMGSPPVSSQTPGIFQAGPNPSLTFRAVPPPAMTVPNNPIPKSVSNGNAGPHQVRFTPPTTMSGLPTAPTAMNGGANASKVAATDPNASQSPTLNSLLNAPSSEMEKRLNQPFQAPKSLFQQPQQAFSASLKDSFKTNAITTSQPNTGGGLFTSTPKQTGKVQVNSALSGQQQVSDSDDNKTSNPVGNAFPPATSDANAPKSLFGNILQAGKPAQTETRPSYSLAQPKDDPKPSGVVANAPFSFKMPPSNPFSPNKLATAAFKTSGTAPATAPEQTTAIPSSVAKISFGPPTAFTGFKGFQPPAAISNSSNASTTLSVTAAVTSSTLSEPVVSAAKFANTNMFSGLYDSVLRTSNCNLTGPDAKASLSAPSAVGEPAKTGSQSKIAVSTDSISSAESQLFKFLMPKPEKEPNEAKEKAATSSESPQKAAPDKQQPQPDVAENVAKSPAAVNKDGDDSFHDPQFEPIVQLEKVTEIKTGEESEEVVFKERCKLYRLWEAQWKERGVGEMKILKNTSDNVVKYRIVMRRDQVRKLCANHVITDQLEPKDHPSNDKMLVWIATDFADEEKRLEQFCAKFKTAEIKQQFREAFEKGVAEYNTKVDGAGKGIQKEKPKTLNEDEAPTVVEEIGTVEQQESKPKSAPAAPSSLLSKFQRKPGEWSCKLCLVTNRGDVTKCAACESPREDEDTKIKSMSSTTVATNQSSHSASAWSSGTSLGKNVLASSTGASSGFQFGSKSGAPASGFSFVKSELVSFGAGNATSNDHATTKPSLFANFGGFGVKSPQSTDSNAPLFNTSSSLLKPPPQTLDSCETPTTEEVTTNPPTSAASTTSSLFGNTSTPSTVQTIFGSSTNASSSLFGQTPASGIFGKAETAPSSILGKTNSEPSTIFGKADYVRSNVLGKPNSDESNNSGKMEPIPSVIFGQPNPGSKPGDVFGTTTPLYQSGGMVFGRPSPSQMATDGKPRVSIFDRPPSSGNVQSNNSADDLEAKAAAAEVGVVIEEGDDEESSRYYCDDDGGEGNEYDDHEQEYDEEECDENEDFYGEEDENEYYEDEEEGEYDEQGYFNQLDGDGNGLRYGGGSSNSPLRPSLLQNVDGKDNPGSATNRFMSPMAKFNSNQSQTPFSSFGAPGSSGGMTPFFARQPPATPKPETVPPKTSSQTTSQQPSSEISELEKSHTEEVGVSERNAGEDVEVIYFRSEAQNLNEEQSSAITEFKLPPLFFDYLTKPDCPGCIGCEDDQGNFGKISQRVYPENQRDRKLKPAAENNEAPLSSDVTSDLPNGSDKTSGFLFGTKTMPGLSFSSLAASESAGFGNKTASQGKQISFAAKPLFASQLKAEANENKRSELESGSTAEEAAGGESEEPDVHFQPIVQLSKVETKSTEENDEVIFSQRAKLFRLVEQEWKERGTGDAKVLRYIPKNIGKFVMRRDVVLKLCANHRIFEETELTPVPNLSGRGFIWVARDFAEGNAEGTVEKFLIKFKNAEIGSEFEAAFNKMRQLTDTTTRTE